MFCALSLIVSPSRAGGRYRVGGTAITERKKLSAVKVFDELLLTLNSNPRMAASLLNSRRR